MCTNAFKLLVKEAKQQSPYNLLYMRACNNNHHSKDEFKMRIKSSQLIITNHSKTSVLKTNGRLIAREFLLQTYFS